MKLTVQKHHFLTKNLKTSMLFVKRQNIFIKNTRKKFAKKKFKFDQISVFAELTNFYYEPISDQLRQKAKIHVNG